jgi:type I restriction enzyme, S subunit
MIDDLFDPWLGDVAGALSLKRLKRIAVLINKKTETSDRAYIGLENIESWTGKFVPGDTGQSNAGISSLFEPGDVLFGKLRPYLAKVGLATALGRCTSELLVLRSKEMEPRLLQYALLSEQFIATVDASTFGAKMPRADWEFIGQVFLPIPRRKQQRAIAAFLDRKTAAIDALITKKERLSELLREKRQALITQVVTKGLDPCVRMKESGIPWLGRVPAHWTVNKLRRIAKRVDVGIAEAATHAYVEVGVPIIRSTNVANNRFDTEHLLFIAPWFAEKNRSKYLRAGDLVTVRTGNAGVTTVVPPNLDKSQCFTLLMTTLRKEHSPEFYDYLLNCDVGRTYFALESWGTAQQNISVPILGGMLVTVPPAVEQTTIVATLQRYVARLDRATRLVEKHVNKLREYRQALITAAVTGKIDVSKELV